MPYASQTLNNPYTGERIIFEQTEQDTGGSVVAFEHFMLPRTMPTFPEHVQLNQEERFEIISGTARYRLNGVEGQAHAGETVIVPPGVIHINCWNAGPEALKMRHSFHPALGTDIFFETIFTLAMNGKTNAKGEVNLLQLAVIANEIESQTFNAGIPIPLQRLALPVLALIGRLLGYRARYSTEK
jgi:oxalate decarboxylase/phosphoglucose isomerase-like protein (cupin superfamily)